MPLDVIMPALGMAQDTGQIVAWHKTPGEAVAEGDVLFEVETDKATMEVEAQGAGYLVDIAAAAGEEVPVGRVIARIADSPEAGQSAPAADAPAAAPDLPEGTAIIMPALGMAQDTGLLVAWHREPGAAVAAEDILFEVETDKSAMEVPAGAAGYLAAVLAAPGDEVPVGEPVAILTAAAPEAPVVRGFAAGPAPRATPAEAPAASAPAKAPPPKPAAPPQTAGDGRILASPKARRLAREQGLDLARLAAAGHPQPYHVRDLDALRAMPDRTAAPTTATAARRRLTARAGAEGFARFADWIAAETGARDPAPLLAAFAAASLRQGDGPLSVSVERLGRARAFTDPDRHGLGRAEADAEPAAPDIVLRDLRPGPLVSVDLGPEAVPVLTLLSAGDGIDLTLECDAAALTAPEAIAVLTDFAGRLDEPLRHLL